MLGNPQVSIECEPCASPTVFQGLWCNYRRPKIACVRACATRCPLTQLLEKMVCYSPRPRARCDLYKSVRRCRLILRSRAGLCSPEQRDIWPSSCPGPTQPPQRSPTLPTDRPRTRSWSKGVRSRPLDPLNKATQCLWIRLDAAAIHQHKAVHFKPQAIHRHSPCTQLSPSHRNSRVQVVCDFAEPPAAVPWRVHR